MLKLCCNTIGQPVWHPTESWKLFEKKHLEVFPKIIKIYVSQKKRGVSQPFMAKTTPSPTKFQLNMSPVHHWTLPITRLPGLTKGG